MLGHVEGEKKKQPKTFRLRFVWALCWANVGPMLGYVGSKLGGTKITRSIQVDMY